MSNAKQTFSVFVVHSFRDMSLIKKIREEFGKFPRIQVVVAEQMRRPGVLLIEKIMELMESCQVVVVVWSHNLEKSIMANQEIGYACALHKIVLPFVMSGMRLKGLLEGSEYVEFDPFNATQDIPILIDEIRTLATHLEYDV